MDNASAQAAVDAATKSNPFAELVAWITLLDAWGYLAIISIVGGLVFAFWRMNRNRDSPFSLADALEDSMTKKTDYVKVMVFGSFVGSWICIFWMLVAGTDVVAIVTLVLGTFVLKSAFDRGAAVVDPRIKAMAYNTAPGSQPPPQPEPPPPVVGDVSTKIEVSKP